MYTLAVKQILIPIALSLVMLFAVRRKAMTNRKYGFLRRLIYAAATLILFTLTTGVEIAFAVPVTLQNGTATFSQSTFSPDLSVDGDLGPSNHGWAIAGDPVSQTAVWETTADVDAAQLDFQLYHNYTFATVPHLLGRFRLSVTSDDRSLFADGLDSGGDVNANWTVLTSPVVSGPGGMTFTTLADHSVLAGGTVPVTAIYSIQYTGSFTGITGIRLEALEHPSLPSNGPGIWTTTDNFVLTEIELDASGTPVPEPSTLLLLGTGLAGLVGYGRRRKRTV